MKFTFFILIICFTKVTHSSEFDGCTATQDCVLLKDGYCARVVAINKSKIKNWKMDDHKKTKQALASNQTCTPLPKEEEIKDFKASCIEKKCVSEKL